MIRSHAPHAPDRSAAARLELLVLGIAVVAAAATVAWLLLRDTSPSTALPTSLAP